MGLDSVEIVMAWEDSLGVTITDQEAALLRTPCQAVDLICRKLGIDVYGPAGRCVSQSAFYRLRRAFTTVFGCPRAAITPRARLSEVVPQWSTREMRSALASQPGVPALPGLPFGSAFLSGYRTFADLTRFLVAKHAKALQGPGGGWTRAQVWEVVRAIVSEQLGVREFSDDADFVHDLGLG